MFSQTHIQNYRKRILVSFTNILCKPFNDSFTIMYAISALKYHTRKNNQEIKDCKYFPLYRDVLSKLICCDVGTGRVSEIFFIGNKVSQSLLISHARKQCGIIFFILNKTGLFDLQKRRKGSI